MKNKSFSLGDCKDAHEHGYALGKADAKKDFEKMIDEWENKWNKDLEGGGYEELFETEVDELKQQLEEKK